MNSLAPPNTPGYRKNICARIHNLKTVRFYEPDNQDWEWQVSKPQCFGEWLTVYKSDSISDDERFSLMEMLIDCVEWLASEELARQDVESLLEWQEVTELLLANPRLHASTIEYWAVFDRNNPKEIFRVTHPMRKVWEAVKHQIV